MNWNMLGAAAQILAAGGVIVTLLYVARQIRDASVEGQRSRYNELATSIASVAQTWSVNAELSDIMLRGLRGVSALDPTEVFRFYASIFGIMKAWEASYHYSLEHGVHDWGASGLRSTMSSFMALPGMQQYWATRRDWYSEQFQREVDRATELGVPRMDEAYSA